MYGELSPGGDLTSAGGGSSPCVRGTLLAISSSVSMTRFIPVCTGNSPISPADMSFHQVHPRVYGELEVIYGKDADEIGSSPCVRGTPI